MPSAPRVVVGLFDAAGPVCRARAVAVHAPSSWGCLATPPALRAS